MAIISCPECGKKISSEAISCPSCGYPLSLKTQKSVKEQAPGFSRTTTMNQEPTNESVIIKAKDMSKESGPKKTHFSVSDKSCFQQGISSYVGISAGSEKTTAGILHNGILSILDCEYPTLEHLDYTSKTKILKDIKCRFENEYSIKVIGAVICVPNYYSIRDRFELIRTAKKSGFDRVKTAGHLAATLLSLSFKVPFPEEGICLSINFGNSYTEAILFEAGDGVFEIIDEFFINTISSQSIKSKLYRHIINYHLILNNIDLSANPEASDRIEKEANRIFDELNSSVDHHVYLSHIFVDRTGSKDIDFYITAEDMNKIMAQTISELESFIHKILLKADSITRVIVLGTLARQPIIKDVLKRKISVDPVFRNDESGIGSAILAGIQSGIVKGILMLEIIPKNINLQNADTITEYFQKGTTIPTSRKIIFSTAEENQRSVGASITEELNGNTHILGEISLDNLPPLRKGSQIEVTLNINPWLVIEANIRVIDTGLSKTIIIE